MNKITTDNSGFTIFNDNKIIDTLVKSQFKGEYQKRAIQKGISQNRAAIFVDMGLGKTFILCTMMNHLKKTHDLGNIVVICPAEGVLNLAMEFIRFSEPAITWDDIFIVDTKHRNPFDSPKKLTIMTYRSLIMLHDDAVKAATGKKQKMIRKNYIPWGVLGKNACIILDESQNIKNATSKTWKILDRAKSFFFFRYIASGTPSSKYACDLWTQMRFLNAQSVPDNYYEFLKSVACLGNRFSDYAINYYYKDKVLTFLRSVAYLVAREKTEGNIELPPVIFRPTYCPMKPFDIKMQQKNHYGDDSNISFDEINGFDDPANKNLNIALSGKFEICQSLLERYKEEGRKVILWSGHPAIIDSLYEKFKSFHPYRLHGDIVINKGESVAERNKTLCDSFLGDKNSTVLIANFSCLSTAVNLVEVTRQIFWDRSWRSDTYMQSVKRSNRIGSKERLIVNDLLFFSSGETRQRKEIDKRLDFNNTLWTNKMQNGTTLTK